MHGTNWAANWAANWADFAGLTVEETAQMLEISPTTVKRDWIAARAWLLTQVRPDGSPRAGVRA